MSEQPIQFIDISDGSDQGENSTNSYDVPITDELMDTEELTADLIMTFQQKAQEIAIATEQNSSSKPAPKKDQPTYKKIFKQLSSLPSTLKVDSRHAHEFVCAITLDNKIMLGISVNGLRGRSYFRYKDKEKMFNMKKMMRWDTGFLELMGGAPLKLARFKERYPKRSEVFLMDKRQFVNGEVFHHSNRRRVGHVIDIKVTADLYIPEYERVIVDVPVTDDNYVVSVNSNFFRHMPIIVTDQKRGRVLDAIFKCILKTKDGRRFNFLASVSGGAGKLTIVKDVRHYNYPIIPGDIVRIMDPNNVKNGIEWLGDEGKLDNTDELEVEQIDLFKVAVRWDPSPRPARRITAYPQSSSFYPNAVSTISNALQEAQEFFSDNKKISNAISEQFMYYKKIVMKKELKLGDLLKQKTSSLDAAKQLLVALGEEAKQSIEPKLAAMQKKNTSTQTSADVSPKASETMEKEAISPIDTILPTSEETTHKDEDMKDISLPNTSTASSSLAKVTVSIPEGLDYHTNPFISSCIAAVLPAVTEFHEKLTKAETSVDNLNKISGINSTLCNALDLPNPKKTVFPPQSALENKMAEWLSNPMGDSPILKRRRQEGYEEQVDWIEVNSLKKHSILPQKKEVQVGSRLKLGGILQILTPEQYHNHLIPKVAKLTGEVVPQLETELLYEVRDFGDKAVYGDVINRHTNVTVQWFDGEIQEDICPMELFKTKKLNHPTDIQVYRNMLLKRSRAPKNMRGEEREKFEKMNAKEFGLVTKVSEENMLTVKWFKKDFATPEEEPYQFQGEEIISQYDMVRHFLTRIPLHSYVYCVINDRDPNNIYSCIGRVERMNDNGTQNLRYLDGEEADFWPGQAIPLDSAGSMPLGLPGGPSASIVMTPFSSYYGAGGPGVSSPTNSSTSSSTATFSPAPISITYYSSLTNSLATANPPPGVPGPSRLVPPVNESTLEWKFIDSLKNSNKGPHTIEGAIALSAVFVINHPNNKSPWSMSPFAPMLNTFQQAMLNCPEYNAAHEMITLVFKKHRTAQEAQRLLNLQKEKPAYVEAINQLLIKAPEGQLLPKAVKMAWTVHKLCCFDISRLRHRQAEDHDSTTVVIYPVENNQATKQHFDTQIYKTPTDDRFPKHLSNGRDRVIFSMLCPAKFMNVPVPPEKVAYISFCNSFYPASTLRTAVDAYKQMNPETGELFVGNMKTLKTNLKIYRAFGRLMAGQPEVHAFNDANDDLEFVTHHVSRADDPIWKDTYHHFYSKLSDRYQNQKDIEVKIEMLDRLDLDLEGLAAKFEFDHSKPVSRLTRYSAREIDPDMMHLKGEVFPELAVPHALVLQISPSLNIASVNDSFIAFQILSQIVDSNTWPDCTIKIHQDCGNNGSLSHNFILAWMILTQKGFLSVPYFNIAECNCLVSKLKANVIEHEGSYWEAFGPDLCRQLRNILMKMGGLVCIKIWRRMNIIEKYFGINRLLDTIKTILNGGNASVIPFKELTKAIEECQDDALKKELAAIQFNHGPSVPTQQKQGTFSTLDVVTSHSFVSNQKREMNRGFVATIKKEHKLLKECIPEGVHVVTFADRLDLLRAIIMGPIDTPYEGVPLLFDIYLTSQYPQEAPKVKYVSLTSQAINPNLYQEGTVCLSLLGTWKGENPTMRWVPGTSNLLQVVCSIQVEILMEANPYFNEPGFEQRRNTEEGQMASKNYNCQVLVGSTEYCADIMNNPPGDFAEILREHAENIMPYYVSRMRGIMDGTMQPSFPININDAVRLVCRRHLDRLEKIVERVKANEAKPAEKKMDIELSSLASMFSVDTTNALTMFSSGNPGTEHNDLNSFVILRQPHTAL